MLDSCYPNQAKIPLITWEDVTLLFQGKFYFEHTHWSIERGRHWAITGDNGSGKLLLMEALIGRIPLVSGRICYYFDATNQGNDATNQDNNAPKHGIPRLYFKRGEIVMLSPEHHRHMVMQHGYHQARWQSFESDGVSLVADFLTGSSIERISAYEVTPLETDEAVYRARRDHAVALLGIEYLLERKLLHLSNGELHKVLLAQALMQSPRLLVLDDPFCGLDIASRATLANVINRIIQEGMIQVLLLTHRIEEIPEGITDIMAVANHQIIKQGPKEEMIVSESAGADRMAAAPGFVLESKPAVPFPVWEPVAGEDILVEMRQVTVTYGEICVLSGIDWQINQGERWAVLGHNGAGKSTLLSLILADNPQVYANDIKLFGKRLEPGTPVWEIRRRIGHVSPELQICYPGGWTCSEVICSGFFDSIGLYRDCSREQLEQAVIWLSYLKLTALSQQPFNTISTGEKRLILLVRALIKHPDLLVLDEPCQGLDFEYRGRILDLLDELCRNTGISILYVTHHMDEMPHFLTRQLKIAQGRIISKGIPET
jgi:molybdate transport system ATP-binding protein